MHLELLCELHIFFVRIQKLLWDDKENLTPRYFSVWNQKFYAQRQYLTLHIVNYNIWVTFNKY
jgi:hypothetical protein